MWQIQRTNEYAMKLLERVVKGERAAEIKICEQHCWSMSSKNTKDAAFALGMLREKYREGEGELCPCRSEEST